MPKHRGPQGRGAPLTIRELGRLVITDYEMNGRKTTRRVEEAYVHLADFFGATPAARIPLRSREYIAHRLAQGAAPATTRLELMALSKGLSIAVSMGRIPFRRPITTPRVRNVRLITISREKLDALLAYLPSDERHVVLMAYLTGWRRSEILGLTWERVDRGNMTIRLHPGTTKNGEARLFPYRRFPLLHMLIEQRFRKTLEIEQRLGAKVAHVFHRDGEPIRTFTRSWRRACARAGLTNVRYHDLRRCAAQNMLRAGVSTQVAMKLMGHKTRTMFDNYAFVDEGDLDDGVARVATYVAGPQNR